MASIINLLASFVLNTFMVWLIVHFFYYPKSHRRDYYFTFILLSVSIFMLIYLLLGDKVSDIGMGAALGLFAIFGIIRYRTESVPIREMTYLFFLVALSVLNGKIGNCGSETEMHLHVLTWALLLVINVVFLACVWVAESHVLVYREGCKFIRYDNIELIRPDRYDELLEDLRQRLGLEILHVEVGAVDFLQDMAMLRVFYKDPGQRIKPVDRIFKIPQDNTF